MKQDSRRAPHRPPRQGQPRRQSSAPAKPVVPITQAMKEGREPMRTFSDLAQFFEHVRSSPPEKKDQDKETGR